MFPALKADFNTSVYEARWTSGLDINCARIQLLLLVIQLEVRGLDIELVISSRYRTSGKVIPAVGGA